MMSRNLIEHKIEILGIQLNLLFIASIFRLGYIGVSGRIYLEKIGYQFNQLYYLFIQSWRPLSKDF